MACFGAQPRYMAFNFSSGRPQACRLVTMWHRPAHQRKKIKKSRNVMLPRAARAGERLPKWRAGALHGRCFGRYRGTCSGMLNDMSAVTRFRPRLSRKWYSTSIMMIQMAEVSRDGETSSSAGGSIISLALSYGERDIGERAVAKICG